MEPGPAPCAICATPHAAGTPCATLHRTPLPADALLGQTIGSFRLQRVLGDGGMGRVYLGEHPVIGKRVAVKVLHPELAGQADVRARFLDEARAVNLIGDENIVEVHDLVELPSGSVAIVMELLEGDTLEARIARGPMPIAEAVGAVAQLARALDAAHAHGVVHRDVKPANVFLVPRPGRPELVKLVDFGIAKLRGSAADSGRTIAGMLIGTPAYMSPEQCLGRPAGAASDIYALGVLAYELVVGRHPFAGTPPMEMLGAHLQREPGRPSAARPELGEAMDGALLRALAKRPEDRYATAGDLAAALRKAAEAPTLPTVEVEATFADGSTARYAAAQATRAGLILRAEPPLPPLRGRVRLAIPAGVAEPLHVEGEVVRHISAEDAARWSLPAGFAVQLFDLTPRARELLGEHVAAIRAPTPAPAPEPFALLALLRAREDGTHYELLGLAPGAAFETIRARGEALRDELAAPTDARLGPAQAAERARLSRRLDAALSGLCQPRERLAYDAAIGNTDGCARALARADLAEADGVRAAWLAAHPGAEQLAEAHAARARMAARLGNVEAAERELSAALRADPCDPELYRLRASLCPPWGRSAPAAAAT